MPFSITFQGEFNIMAKEKKFPVYLYHKNEQDPILINNKDDERALTEKGWQRGYIHKDYPKYVNGTIVNSKAEHDALLAQQPKVVKGKSTVVVE